MSENRIPGDGMNELLSALARVDTPKVEVVSDTDADNGLLRLIVRSDSTISVEIDPYAAEDVSVGEVERHLRRLFNAAKFPKPQSDGGR
ncbi:hypothetical protein O1R50_23870 [Glycomyces luteolus]|uniref:Uncharacterized protein n=1 Tax=Glycomyces luteolus TaxID=2670330 RepID=A0A9X3T698_9ACTN|nr:hypothetical protein [Glycomyces luteolus]MDA1362680.1 hypothetical protein [Glycomyces luteolus]